MAHSRRKPLPVWLAVVIALLLSSCCRCPTSVHYQEAYAHLEGPIPRLACEEEPDYYVVFLVAARHFDYEDTNKLLRTMVKSPTDGCKDGSVGHAWLLLRGFEGGEEVVIEGGHSGELGEVQPKYAAGVMNYLQYGYADPTEEQKKRPRHEPNPVKYLWSVQRDGYFEYGSGGYEPTFAALVPISEEQYWTIREFICPENYPYRDYSITDNQCCTFVARVGALIDFEIEHSITVPVDPCIQIFGNDVQVWEDPFYSELTISVPDIVERSLIKAVREERAFYALDWYFASFPEKKRSALSRHVEDLYLLPSRVQRLLLFR